MLAALAVVGCSGPSQLELITAELPEDVAWIGVAATRADGTWLGASGLGQRRDGAVVVVVPETARAPEVLEVVAFTAAQLSAVAPEPSAELLWSAALAPASADDRRLPPPRFTARFDAEGAPLAPGAELALTASWLPRCPEVLERDEVPLVDASCTHESCASTVTQEGCALELKLCNDLSLSVALGARGEILPANNAQLGACEEIPARAPASRTIRCSGGAERACTIDLHRSVTPPPLAVEPLHLESVTPLERTGIYRGDEGYLHGLAVLDREIVVASSGETSTFWAECRQELDWRFHWIDAERWAVTRTSTAPPCTSALISSGSGFVVAHGGTERWISRFDGRGRLQASRRLSDPSLEARHTTAALYADQERLLVLQSFEGDPTVRSFVLTLDPVTLELRRISAPIIGPALVLAEGGPDAVVVATTIADALVRLRVQDLSTLPAPSPRGACSAGVGLSPGAFLWHAPSERLAFGAFDGASSALYFLPLDGDELCTHARFTAFKAQAVALLRWPSDPSRWLVAVSSPDGSRTAITFADPDGERIWPGAIDTGIGPLRHGAPDRTGALVATLPWSGTVLRISD